MTPLESSTLHHALWARDLLLLDSARLIARYNDALERVGLEPTALTRFHVDGRGWSPEIAAEQGHDYLQLSPGNPLAIVVAPDQRGQASLAPAVSFDEPLLEQYHQQFQREIADITRDACLALELDGGLSRYRDPFELLLLTEVTVRAHPGPASAAAAEQAELVRRFLEGEAWGDAALRQQILASARAHGDLRDRQLTIAPWRFGGVRSFFAAAFGGLFVLRSPGQEPGQKPAYEENSYLVLCDPAAREALGERANDTFAIDDPELLEQLQAETLIDLDLEWYAQHPEALQALLEQLTVDVLTTAEPQRDPRTLSAPQRKRRLAELGDRVPERLFELEKLILQLERGRQVPADALSASLQRLLLRPDDAVTGAERRAVWQLLCRLEPVAVERLYRFDRARCFALFSSWPPGKQQWLAARLLESIETDRK